MTSDDPAHQVLPFQPLAGAQVRNPLIKIKDVSLYFYEKKKKAENKKRPANRQSSDADERKKTFLESEVLDAAESKGDKKGRLARLFGFLSVVKPKKVKLALSDISLDLYQNDIIGLIGASGSGKSTLLKCINRLHESLDKPPIFKGNISIDGEDINHPDLDIVALRSKVGMVFQKPNPFPKTIRDNVLYGARIHGLIPPGEEDAYLEKYLRKAALWDEVKDRLDDELGTDLSGGQQQRLCIARAIASQPEILLMDEPTSALDPKSTVKIEQLMLELKKEMTIVLVTHSLGQAKRVTDYLVFLEEGRVIEHGLSDDLFNSPQTSELREYYAYEAGSDISATGTGPEKPHA